MDEPLPSSESDRPSVLVFGASGAIGAALCEWHRQRRWNVVGVTRTGAAPDIAGVSAWASWDVGRSTNALAELQPRVFDAAIWAHGMNCTDNIRSFDLRRHRAMYDANVIYILESLEALLAHNLLATGARLCVVSSIWQNIARQNKLSYCISKSALQGLVQAMAIDLGREKILINAVLPGPLDTPMTRANLAAHQIDGLKSAIPLGSLPSLDDVCGLVGFLCSAENSGVTGQFVAADRGFSHARIL